MSRAASAAGEHAMLKPLRDESRQLDPAVRMSMERSMSASFGDVVVYTGEASSQAAEGLDAAAFTVGRHVVFGPGRYNPGSLRGQMLIAHELAHVVEQRRGGGDPDLGEREPESSIARHATHGEGDQTTAARAALGSSARVAGATSVGVARQDKDDEDGFATWLAVKVRGKVKEGIGTVEGVVGVAAGLAETVVWVPSKLSQAKDAAVDAVGRAFDVDKETLEVIKFDNYKVMHAVAAEAGLVDTETGAIVFTPTVTATADWVERRVDESPVFEGLPAEDGFFTDRELAQLQAAIVAQVGLAFIGVAEVQLVLKILGGVGAAKGVFDAAEKSKAPGGFLQDRAFWMAIAQGVLFLLGLKSTAAGNKVLALAVHIGSTTLSGTSEALNVYEAYNMPPGEERNKRLKASISALAHLLAEQVRQAITTGRGLPGKGKAAADKPPHADPPATTSQPAKDAPKTLGPPAPKTSDLPETGTQPPKSGPSATQPSKTKAPGTKAPSSPAKAAGKTKSSKPSKTKAAKKPSPPKSSTPKKGSTTKSAVAKSSTKTTGPGKQTPKGPKSPQGSNPSKSRAMTPEVKAAMARARELTKLASGKGDDAKRAAEELADVYAEAPADALKRMAKDKKLGADPRVRAELDRRAPANDEAQKIMSGEFEPGRLPHEATVVITTDDGKPVYHSVDDPNRKPGDPIKLEPAQKDLKSGGMKPERVKKVGFREASNEVHTEAKAVQLPLVKGQTMTIIGQYDPCGPCKSRMQAKANSSGGTVVYWWPGGPPETFTPKVP